MIKLLNSPMPLRLDTESFAFPSDGSVCQFLSQQFFVLVTIISTLFLTVFSYFQTLYKYPKPGIREGIALMLLFPLNLQSNNYSKRQN